MTTKISTDNIQASALTALSAVKVSNVAISNSTYYVLDDTAVNVGGGYIVVTGSGFVDGATVLISGTQASAVTYVDSTELHVQVPAKSAATYNLYVVNPDGSTAIRVNGLTYSGTPTWVTTSPLDNQAVDVAFNLNFDATGATSYSNTTALPAGTDLLSNGYFYGTVTGIVEETTYNFTIQATDAENQDSAKTFSVTVTVGPPPNYLYSWGYNFHGALALNDTTHRSSPIQVGILDWSSIGDNPFQSSTPTSFMITKADGTLWSWGGNISGRLGLNDTVYRSSPSQIGSLTNWSKVTMGGGSWTSGAIKTDGTLWTWGNGGSSAFGVGLAQNSVVAKSSPTQVGTDTDWSFLVLADNSLGAAIKTDGTLWMWGNSNYGSLGLNTTGYTQSKSSPVQIGTSTDWSMVTLGVYAAMAVKTDGTLWAWGWNISNQLGLNNVSNPISSPTQVGTLTNWSHVKIADQAQSTMALKTDGTLWVWGDNTNGRLGLNDTTARNSPVKLGNDTNWTTKFSHGYSSGGAIKSDGTLWLWGQNNYGQLGQNENVGNKSSPIQLGSDTTWTGIGIVGRSNFATKTG